MYRRPCDILRSDLRVVLKKMRLQIKESLNGKIPLKKNELIHQQPIAQMGDYINYRNSRDKDSSLREANPISERFDTFGNPFKRKSSFFVPDESYVDEMNPLGIDNNLNVSFVSQGYKLNGQTKNSQQRSKGKLV